MDIVELVGQWVKLKRAGENWKGLCPFHTEKTPSFTVNPKKGIFHCFGCKAGGDAFSFLRKQERLDFPEAVRAARRARGRGAADRAAPSASRTAGSRALRRLMARAAQFYGEAPLGARTMPAPRRRALSRGRGAWRPRWPGASAWAMRRRAGTTCSASCARQRHRRGAPRPGRPRPPAPERRRLLRPLPRPAHVLDPGCRRAGWSPSGAARSAPTRSKYINSPGDAAVREGPDRSTGSTWRKPAHPGARTAPWWSRVTSTASWRTSTASPRRWPRWAPPSPPPSSGSSSATPRRSSPSSTPTPPGRRPPPALEEMMSDTMDIQGLAWAVARTGGFERSGYFPVKVAVLPPGHDPDSLLRAEGAAAFQSRLDAARSILSFVMQQALSEEDLSTARGRATAHARVALILSKVPNAEEATTPRRAGGPRAAGGRDPALDRGPAAPARADDPVAVPAPRRRRRAARPRGWPAPSLAERDLLLLLLRVDEARRRAAAHRRGRGRRAPRPARHARRPPRARPTRPAEALMHRAAGRRRARAAGRACSSTSGSWPTPRRRSSELRPPFRDPPARSGASPRPPSPSRRPRPRASPPCPGSRPSSSRLQQAARP